MKMAPTLQLSEDTGWGEVSLEGTGSGSAVLRWCHRNPRSRDRGWVGKTLGEVMADDLSHLVKGVTWLRPAAPRWLASYRIS